MIPCLEPVLIITLEFSWRAISGPKTWATLKMPRALVPSTAFQSFWRSSTERVSEMAGHGRAIPALFRRIWTSPYVSITFSRRARTSVTELTSHLTASVSFAPAAFTDFSAASRGATSTRTMERFLDAR